jgi:MFS transporter, MHS family, proline/betaine transporter
MSAQEAETRSEKSGRTSRRMALVAGTIGHAIEWFDFVLFGVMAAILTTVFFPKDFQRTGLLLTLAIYAAGYGARLFGGFVFGRLGDTWGRTRTLSVIIVLMSGASLVTGLLPGYEAIGIWAPVLLFLVRVIQGFASGGEFGSSSALLVEYAPPNKRGLYGSWQQWGVLLSIFAGSVILSVISNALPAAALHSWGWRVPFLFAAVVGLFGFYLRTKIEDTPDFTEARAEGTTTKTPLRTTFRTCRRPLIVTTCYMAFWTSAGAMAYNYSPTFASTWSKMTFGQITPGLSVVLLGAMIVFPLVGRLSDRVGRKPLLMLGVLLFVVFSVPAYWLILQGSVVTFVLGVGLMGVAHMLTSAVTPTLFAEWFPVEVRATGLAQAFNIGVAFVGALTPLAFSYLIQATGAPLAAPAVTAAMALVVLVVVVPMVPETSPAERPAANWRRLLSRSRA